MFHIRSTAVRLRIRALIHRGVFTPLPSQHVPIVIVGTKSDLTEERQVQRETLMQLSAMWGTCRPFSFRPVLSHWLPGRRPSGASLFPPKPLINHRIFSTESPIYETSVKKDWHVKDVFEDLIRQMRLRYPLVPRRPGPHRKRHPRVNDAEPPGKCIAM